MRHLREPTIWKYLTILIAAWLLVWSPATAQERVQDIGQDDAADDAPTAVTDIDDEFDDGAAPALLDGEDSLAWPPPDDLSSVLLETDEEITDEDAQLLTEEGEVPVTAPRGGIAAEADALPRSGSLLNNRRCRLYLDPNTQWVLVRVLNEEGLPPEPPRWALPNPVLEQMEDIVVQEPGTIFRVSGENMIHRRQVFLLIRRAGVLGDDDLPVDSGVDPPDTAAADTADDDADDGEADDDAETPSADDVMAAMRADRTGEPVLPPAQEPYTDREQPPSEAPADGVPVFAPGVGHLVVDRLVRILPVGEGNWVEAVFEADNTGNEPPIRLLPNHMLPGVPDANNAAAMTRPIPRYTVSGEILQYRGRQYLLLRKCIIKRDMNEF